MGGEVTMVLHCCDVASPEALARRVPDVKRTLEVSVLSHFWVSRLIIFELPPALVRAPNATQRLFSPFRFIQILDSVLPGMRRAGRGHIVALSSSVANLSGAATDIAARVAISTAQFAVQGFAESLHTAFRRSNTKIIMTLVHVYPFVIGAETPKDIGRPTSSGSRYAPGTRAKRKRRRSNWPVRRNKDVYLFENRIPSYFGTMPASDAARKILNGVRRDYAEFSVPGYLLYLGHVLR